jgi:formyltetrahydrofolate-dependent phosphoribosylglycinamide formyltransferase
MTNPPAKPRARVAVLISGTGSNMAALLYASRLPGAAYEVVLVASNDAAAPGLGLAEAEGVATFALSHKGMDRAAHEDALDRRIRESGAQFVALAGYMRILTPRFVERWQGRMLNIHPSLLPKYTGLDTHAAALAAGDSHAGCTVHEVTAALDDGPLLGQVAVAVLPGDTPQTLAARVLIAEHQLYSRCLGEFVSRETSPEYLVGRVRERALALPVSDETLSHGMPCFGVIKGKKFAYVTLDHHGDGKTALLVKISGPDEQAQLIENDPERYYRPAYFGDGWIGLRLDLGDTDWDAVGEWLARSWRSIAPRRLTALIDAADQF